MRIIFYCQYVYGMGHLFRSIELVSAFDGHDVLLIVGGRPVKVRRLPGHVRMRHLPALYMDERFTTLIPGEKGKDVDSIQAGRKQVLFDCFEQHRPDLFVTELYPFGRRIFEFELIPLLEAVRSGRFGPIRTVCSLRDVLVEKRDPQAFENRVLDRLNRFYDELWVHSDKHVLPLEETFSRVSQIRIPVHYTGFVAQAPDPRKGELLRQELELTPSHKLVVASAGGGRSGSRLLHNTIRACRVLQADRLPQIKLIVFAGPFMDAADYRRLEELQDPTVIVRRFTGRFLDYLSAADLSISMAGYNTCMNLLATGVTALVHPYARQQEQPIRARKISRLAPVKVLSEADIDPDRLRGHIETVLKDGMPPVSRQLNLSGAISTSLLVKHPSP